MSLGTRAGLILGLAEGPAFGVQLVRRVSKGSNGAVQPNLGGASTALRALERDGLVRAWTHAVGGVGRPRRYYELSADGIQAAEKLRRDLAGLVAPRRSEVSVEERRAMADRLQRASVLSASVIALRDAGRQAGLG